MMFDYNRVKQDTRDVLLDYINHGHEPGGFLIAVLSNNLKESFRRADYENYMTIGDIVAWLYNNAPSPCCGSPEAVSNWTEQPAWILVHDPITWERGV